MRIIILGSLLLSSLCAAAGKEAAGPVSFTEAIKQIVTRNTTIAIQRSRLSASESVLLSRHLVFLPSLSLRGSQQETGDPALLTKSASLNASLNLFRSGADLASLNAAQAGRDYEQVSLQNEVLRAEFDAVDSLVSFVETTLRLEILIRQIEHTQEFLNIAQVRYRKGLLPIEDVNRLEIDLSNERASLDDTVSQLNSAKARLAALLGHADVEVSWPWKALLASSKSQELLKRAADIEGRPDFRAAQLLRDREDHSTRRLYRNMLPTIDLSYSKWNSEIGGQWTPGWTTLLTLTIPLFDGFQDYSAYRVQSEVRTQAELALERFRRDELANQKAYQQNFKLALQTAQGREKTLVISERLLNVNLARFKSGRADANELSVERSRKAQAETLAVQGWAKAHLSFVRLKHSFGESIQNL